MFIYSGVRTKSSLVKDMLNKARLELEKGKSLEHLFQKPRKPSEKNPYMYDLQTLFVVLEISPKDLKA